MENNKTEKFKDESIEQSKDKSMVDKMKNAEGKANDKIEKDVARKVDRKERAVLKDLSKEERRKYSEERRKKTRISMELDRTVRRKLEYIMEILGDEISYETVEREIIDDIWVNTGEITTIEDGEFRTALHEYIDAYIEGKADRRMLILLGKTGRREGHDI